MQTQLILPQRSLYLVNRFLLCRSSKQQQRQAHPLLLSCTRRCFSGSSAPIKSNNDINAVISRKLYRILQRHCIELQKYSMENNNGDNDNNKFILLQPQLDPRDTGMNRSFPTATTITKSSSLVRFFRNRLLSGSNNNNDDNNDNDNDELDDYIHRFLSSIENKENNNNNKKNDNETTHDDEDEQSLEYYYEPTAWIDIRSIQSTIRQLYRTPKNNNNNNNDINNNHKLNKTFAIEAFKFLSEQAALQRMTSVSFHQDIRVVATSCYAGSAVVKHNPVADHKNNLSSGTKHRFSYRIRIENLSKDNQAVQLLGRTWHIRELNHDDNQDNNNNNDNNDDSSCTTQTKKPPMIVVKAPTSGAVGQLPVLHPGDAFEYMSACELGTNWGGMEGSFHFARVPNGTPSAMLGTQIEAFSLPEDDKFVVPVNPFPLEVCADYEKTRNKPSRTEKNKNNALQNW